MLARVADWALLCLWGSVGLFHLAYTWLASARRRPGRQSSGAAARTLLAAAACIMLLALSFPLEERLGRLPPSPLGVAAGLVLGIGGAALFVRARLALGDRWQASARALPAGPLLRTGPYARLRHPLYAAALLLAAATPLLHPSPAALLAAGGFAAGTLLKTWAEDRWLRRALGGEYQRYARDVPALVPRVGRRRRPEHPRS